ncbi:MAG TPA: hypothetical protein P5531_04055 [Bacteroidales bacterium]|nr:hypothetical protein [Bacteroidales bacterium]
MSESVTIVVNETTEVVQITVTPATESPTVNVEQTSDKYYRHTQALPAAVWTVTHNLGKRPSVTVTDTAGTQVEGQVDYVNSNTLTITFSAPFSGYAELN